MTGTPIFAEFCATIEQRGGEEYVFDRLRAGDSVNTIAKDFGRSKDLLYKWKRMGGADRGRKWDEARREGADAWIDKSVEVIEDLPAKGNLAADVAAARGKSEMYQRFGQLANPEKFDKAAAAAGSAADLMLEVFRAVQLQRAEEAKQLAKPEPEVIQAEVIRDDG